MENLQELVRHWRTIIHIEGVRDGMVTARIAGWDSRKKWQFPLSIVPENLRSTVVPGGYLIAKVNIGAEKAEDLSIRDIEAAPEPVPEEELE